MRLVAGRWHDELPSPDPGFDGEVRGDGVAVFTARRPPFNLIDAAMVSRWTQVVRDFNNDPELVIAIARSGLAQYYHVRDMTGNLILDPRGKPKRISAIMAESEALPPGYTLVGPIRPFGGGADLSIMASNPLNALFTLWGSIDIAAEQWYARKPVVFVCEGDCVAGWFEVALYSNLFLVTKNARVGAPEVKSGLTLPFGAHALQFRGGTAVAQHLMGTGDLIGGEEAVKLGLADGIIPDGVDPVQYAIDLAQSRECRDRVHQVSLLRQYGPPIRKLIAKSVRNYIRMLRNPETRRRMGRYVRYD
jgi:enoyl-CoA hydratase/carnithine racemase